MTIPIHRTCNFLHHNGKLLMQTQGSVDDIQHGRIHFKVGTPLWYHNKYIIRLTAIPYFETEFDLDDFLFDSFLPFNIASSQGISVNPSLFSKTVHVHQKVTKVTSTKWPKNKLKHYIFDKNLKGTLIGNFMKKRDPQYKHEYGTLLFDRWVWKKCIGTEKGRAEAPLEQWCCSFLQVSFFGTR